MSWFFNSSEYLYFTYTVLSISLCLFCGIKRILVELMELWRHKWGWRRVGGKYVGPLLTNTDCRRQVTHFHFSRFSFPSIIAFHSFNFFQLSHPCQVNSLIYTENLSIVFYRIHMTTLPYPVVASYHTTMLFNCIFIVLKMSQCAQLTQQINKYAPDHQSVFFREIVGRHQSIVGRVVLEEIPITSSLGVSIKTHRPQLK